MSRMSFPAAKLLGSLFLFAALFCVSSPAAFAQTARASLSGRALDQHGAAVPGARVTLTQAGTRVEFAATADDAGAYAFKELAPGAYTLTAGGQGFTARAEELTLAAGEARSVDLTLRPAELAEDVVVSSSRIAGTPEVVERIPGSVEILGTEQLETARVF